MGVSSGGIIGRIFGARRKAAPAVGPDEILLERRTFANATGVAVGWKRALQVATFLACIRVKAHGVAQVPFRLMRRLENGDSAEASNLALADVLAHRPNEWMTSFELREGMMWHLGVLGNAFLFINRVAGQVVELIPLDPTRITVEQGRDYRLSYTYRAGAETQVFPQESIWHLRGPSWNGWMGQETVGLLRETLGLTAAIEQSQGALHANGVQTSGAWSVESTLSDDQHRQLSAWLKKHYVGPDKAGVPLILDRAAKWQSTAMTGADAQTLESRRLQIEEICRGLGVMPVMVGHADKTATYASVEQMLLAHVVHTLAPEYARIEQSASAQLLSAAQRRAGYYVKLFDQALMRGAARDRADFYQKGVLSGWLTRNEVRRLEDLNRLDGLDDPLTPQNMAVGGDPAPDDTDNNNDNRDRDQDRED